MFISIFNLKGGVGKTTTTINLACSLDNLGKKALVIDLDPQVNTTPVLMNLRPGIITAREIMMGGINSKYCINKASFGSLDIVPGDIDLFGDYDADSLKRWMDKNDIATKYDFVLIDCNPSLIASTRNALSCCDIVLSPAVLDRFCMDNLELLRRTIVSDSGISSHADWYVFANRVKNIKSQRAIYQEVISSEKFPFLNTCISERATVPNALVKRKPVFAHSSRSIVADEFMQLAREVADLHST